MTEEDYELYLEGHEKIWQGLACITRFAIKQNDKRLLAIENEFFFQVVLGLNKIKQHLEITNGQQSPS